MYSHRGRGGPRQQTPANVLCQKCLKRARHYSYECKAAPQERPYVARPSRTQQLLNPKLKPKLTNDVLDPVERKKGVADEELAKKEAERARKRDLEKEDDDELPSKESRAKRQRSVSVDSVSTISTRPSRSPPPRRRRSSSGHRAPLQDSRRVSRSRSYSSDYDNGHDQRHSPNPIRGADARKSLERSLSPRRDELERAPREHSSEESRPRHNRSRRDDDRPEDYRRHDSRSPERGPVRGRGRGRYDDSRRYRHRDDPAREQDERPLRSPPRRGPPPERQRSPSPFSKRLALTQAMNMGR